MLHPPVLGREFRSLTFVRDDRGEEWDDRGGKGMTEGEKATKWTIEDGRGDRGLAEGRGKQGQQDLYVK